MEILKLSKLELLNKCKELNIKYNNRLKKEDLINLINKENETINKYKTTEENNIIKEHKSTEENNIIKEHKSTEENKSTKENETIIIKPLIKWVGGKTQILEKVLNEFPKEINNYNEIFLGGGSVLLGLLSYVKEGKIKVNGVIKVYDLNESLINLYKNVRDRAEELYENINNIIKEYNDCDDGKINRKPKNIKEAKSSKESYYYWIRSQYNIINKGETNITESSMFIFLNKTCFRGLYRMGPHGFNVPYGHYVNPEIINKKHLMEISSLIKDVIFEKSDFMDSIEKVEENDFVYLDPPYVPEKEKSFVSYTTEGFSNSSHLKLFEKCNYLNKTNKKFMMSNADVKLVRDYFSNNYNIESIECKRTINSKKPDSKTKELLIKNY
jgi:DNA adenine methylase